MRENLVSIIVPIYNCSSVLDRCLRSISAQSYQDYEVILIDDGSTDESGTICKRYVLADERFRYVRTENQGVSAARNRGLDMSTGEYITFVDSDDWLEEGFLTIMQEHIQKSMADIVCCCFKKCSFEDVEEFKVESVLLRPDEALDGFSSYYYTSVWAKLYRRTTLHDLRFAVDIAYSEDTLFYTEAVLGSKKIEWISDCLYNYYDNQLGAMHDKNPYLYGTDLIARERILDLYKENSIDLKSAIYRLVISALDVKYVLFKNHIFDSSDIRNANLILKKYIYYLHDFKYRIKYYALFIVEWFVKL